MTVPAKYNGSLHVSWNSISKWSHHSLSDESRLIDYQRQCGPTDHLCQGESNLSKGLSVQ